MQKSRIFRLNKRDLLISFLIAFIAFFIKFLQETFIPQLDIPENIKLMIIAALSVLSKNFFTPM